MKKTIISLSILAVAAASGLILNSNMPSGASQVFSRTINPETPRSVSLCGKKVDLDRVDMWERFDRELTAMTYTHGSVLLTIKRANKYFPEMAPILKANGVPEDLLYLACIESWLNPRAYSPAKAAGIWQFMPATAKQYGLEVSDEVDERYNLEKATAAACRYMKKAYAKYGDWSSVMAAYNGGMGRISSELEAQGGDNAMDLYLVEETSRYPFRVMAMKTIMEHPRAFGFTIKADQLYQPRKYKTVKVSEAVADWSEWARRHGISYAQLREENPWIRAKKLTNKTGKTYTVRIPTEQSLSRSKQAKSIYDENWVSE